MVTELTVNGRDATTPPDQASRPPVSLRTAIVALGLVAAAVVFLALTLAHKPPAPAPAAVAVAHTIRVDVIGAVAGGGAIVWAGNAITNLAPGETRTIVDLKSVTVAVAAGSPGDGTASCQISVDGVVADHERGNGTPGQALCVWVAKD